MVCSCTTLIYFMYASVYWHRTCTCNRVHFYSCMRQCTHFDLSNISCTADRQRQTESSAMVGVMSGNIIEGELFKHYIEQPPHYQFGEISKHSEVKTISQIGCCCSTTQSCCCAEHCRTSGVHFWPVMSDQKVHWKQQEEQKEPVFVSTFVNLESSG